MNTQTLKSRRSQAQDARKQAQQAADDAFDAYLDSGRDDALRRFTEATSKANALRDAVQRTDDQIEEANAPSWTDASREREPFDLEAHRKKERAYKARLDTLARQYEKAHDGVQAVNYSDVLEWAKRTGRDVPEAPEDPFRT